VEVRLLGDAAETVYLPAWALVEYRPESGQGESRLAVWRFGPEGEARALYTPDPRWLRALLRRLEEARGNRQKELEWVHPRLLVRGEERMAWWRPAWPAPMHFTLPALEDLSGEVFPQPPLLFLQVREQIHLFALPKEQRPGPDTPLLLAPYFNYYTDRGWVCWGTGPVPPKEERANLEAWENAFFASAFSHASGAPLKKGTLSDLWRGLKGKKRFPLGRLKPAGLTVREAVERLLGR
jgi:PRTRC genetic system protein B